MFTSFDLHSAHLENGKKQALIINGSWLIAIG